MLLPQDENDAEVERWNGINCRDAVTLGGSNLDQAVDDSWTSNYEVCACDC